MKLRWTRLRTLLFVTGLFSLILLIFAEEVAQISGSGLLETALTTGFALSPISFLVVGSVGLGKKAVRDVRKVYNQRVAKCSICDEALLEASLRQVGRLHSFHYQTVHPDAWNWNQKWRRVWVLTVVPCVLLFIFAMYIVLSGNYLGFLVVALPMIPLLTLTWLRSLKLRQFRREWTTRERGV